MDIGQAQENYEAALKKGLIHPDHTMFTTPLTSAEEDAFRTAVYGNNAFPGVDTASIFHPTTDYDYRGLWKAQQAGDPRSRVTPGAQGQMLYPSTFRTPFHPNYGSDSIYAKPPANPMMGGYAPGGTAQVAANPQQFTVRNLTGSNRWLMP